MNRRAKARKLSNGAGVKNPKTDVGTTSAVANSQPTFSFRHVDRKFIGDWRWPSGPDLDRVVNFLCDISTSTWGEIWAQQTGSKRRRRKHHEMPVEDLCPEAKQRLQDLQLDEMFDGEIFRFRLHGLGRLWGFATNGVFYPVWWDPDHKVFPTEKE